MFVQELFGTFIGQISLVTIAIILGMAYYFVRKFKSWAERDEALEKQRAKKS